MESTGIPMQLDSGQTYKDFLAQQLMQQGQSNQVYSPMQGMGDILSSLVGAYLMKKNGGKNGQPAAPWQGMPYE